MRQIATTLLLAALAAVTTPLTGCTGQTLAGAPNLYSNPAGMKEPFASVPVPLQTTDATIIYATDRTTELVDGKEVYGIGRSPELEFGTCIVRMGSEETTWTDLVAASTKAELAGTIPLLLNAPVETGRFPRLDVAFESDGSWVESPACRQRRAEAVEQVQAMLRQQLAETPVKELFIFVHGYNNTFADGAFRAAQIWHFAGRGGVPVLYSWPAGSPGLLKGYTRDRESSEYTVPHFKEFLLAAAKCPEVSKINIIGHSRGTDVVANALREIHMECRGGGKDTRTFLKLGNVVLAAPDIDLDVFLQRFKSDRVGFIAERFTIYVSPNDSAIGLSAWLFGSVRRLGQAGMSDLSPQDAAATKVHPITSVIDVRASTIGMGHDYFLSNPATLSDLILVLREHRAPGAANGRPLVDDPKGFWELFDGYPFRKAP